MEIVQYQIVLVNLDHTIGGEIKKTRPSVIISPDEMNRYLDTIVISPITNSSRNYPTRVKIKHDKTNGWIVLDQISTVYKQRIIKVLDNLTEKEIEKTKSVIKETYVD